MEHHGPAARIGGGPTFGLTWVWGLLRRRTLAVVGAALGVALAVAFLGSLGAFFTVSKAQMTARALRGVPVDWQVQLAPGADVASAGRVIAATPGVVRSLPVGYADTPGFSAPFDSQIGPQSSRKTPTPKMPLVRSVPTVSAGGKPLLVHRAGMFGKRGSPIT